MASIVRDGRVHKRKNIERSDTPTNKIARHNELQQSPGPLETKHNELQDEEYPLGQSTPPSFPTQFADHEETPSSIVTMPTPTTKIDGATKRLDYDNESSDEHHKGTPGSIISRPTPTIGGAGPGRHWDFSSSHSGKAIRVSIDVNSEEYILKLTRVTTENAMAEHAYTGAVLLAQGEKLRKMGEELFSQFQLPSIL